MSRVLLTATSYPADAGDWRGRFIFDMTESLARVENIDLSLWAPPGDLPIGVQSALLDDDAAWLKGMLEQGGIAHLLRRQPIAGGLRAISLLRRLRHVYRDFERLGGPAVVHANWIQNALPLMGTRLPALITVLGSDLALLRLPGMVRMVRAMLSKRKAILAPNAEWMVPLLHRHFGDLAEIRPILFGVHERWFAIKRHANAAQSGDWVMVSRVTKEKLGHIFDWGNGVFGQGRKLHLLGPMQESLILPEWIQYYGPTNPEALAAEWFPKAAGLVTLSTHDEGRPQVMIEAMAAGLPVIASDLPAHRDLLRNRETGWLVSSRDELCEGLAYFEDSNHNLAIGQLTRNAIKASIGTWGDCADRYLAAYQILLERNREL